MKKVITIFLSLVLLAGSMAACSSNTADTPDAKQTTASAESVKDGTTSAQADDEPQAVPEIELGQVSALTVEKLNTVSVDFSLNGEGGFYYKGENGLTGTMTFDGKGDSGAVYTYCSPQKKYFIVSTKEKPETMTIEAMNSIGVADAEGNILVPEEYASVSVLNDRYIKACKATAVTDNEDEALIFAKDGYGIFYEDGDALFKGEWCVYDVTTGEKVPGAQGTSAFIVYAKGNYLSYTTDDEKAHKTDAAGNELPADAKLYDNGSYSAKSEKGITVYDGEGNAMFDIAESTVYITAYNDGYYNIYDSTNKAYYLMNDNGEKVSADFASSVNVYGKLLLSDKVLYNFEGEALTDLECKSVRFDSFSGALWRVESEEETVIIDVNGTVLYRSSADENIFADSFTPYKKTDEGNFFYSHADKDYTIKASSRMESMLVKNSVEDGYEVIDTVSGKVILEGYKNYSYVYVSSAGQYYIYAFLADGGMDIYSVGVE